MSLSVEQINKLESENERLKEEIKINLQRANALNRELNQLQTCLQEIKEIAQRGFNNSQCNCGLKADMEKILQKIAECEV